MFFWHNCHSENLQVSLILITKLILVYITKFKLLRIKIYWLKKIKELMLEWIYQYFVFQVFKFLGEYLKYMKRQLISEI